MSELSPEAIKLIENQCEKLLAEERTVLNEMNLYRWILRALFVVLLGGSIFGFFKIQEFVDDRVAARVENQETLYLGAVLNATGDPRGAIQKFEEFLQRASNITGSRSIQNNPWWNVSQISQEQRTFIYVSLLAALAAVDDKDSNGEFIGKADWQSLISDNNFRIALSESPTFELNSRFNYNMGLAYMHFADGKDQVVAARNYLIRAGQISQDKNGLGPIDFYLSMIDLLLDNKKSALSEAELAVDWNSYTTSFRNAVDAADFMTKSDWHIFERLWKKLNAGDLSSQLRQFMYDVEDAHNENVLNERATSVGILNTDEKRNNFRKVAIDAMAQVARAWEKRDKKALRALTTTPLYAALAVLFDDPSTKEFYGKLDKVGLSRISDVYKRGGGSFALVEFWLTTDTVNISSDMTEESGISFTVEFEATANRNDPKWLLNSMPIKNAVFGTELGPH